MKILCPTDFSLCSTNAVKWAADFLDAQGGGVLELLHCIDFKSRSDVFIKLDDVLKERAVEDFKDLQKELELKHRQIKIVTSIYKANAKEFIPQRAHEIEADLIVMGSTGLTSLKDMVMGSVTEYVANKSDIPVMTIPDDLDFEHMNSVVFGIDDKAIENSGPLYSVAEWLVKFNPLIYLTQVTKTKDQTMVFDHKIVDIFENLFTQNVRINKEGSVVKSLNQFVKDVDADVLCIIHHQRSWWQKLFKMSNLKEELYDLNVALLILPT